MNLPPMSDALKAAVDAMDARAIELELTTPQDCLGRMDDPMQQRRDAYYTARKKVLLMALLEGQVAGLNEALTTMGLPPRT